jgi:hypothetical protein
MAKLTYQKIREIALALVEANPGGIRYSDLVDLISKQSSETPRNSIRGSVWSLDIAFPTKVVKPSRGLFTPLKKADNDILVVGNTEQISAGVKIKESDFYASFADWLKNDLDEVTQVVQLGGAAMKSKWGTPDVIGVYKPLAGNLIKFPIEIVSAEIKIDPQAPVVAFGQSVAYRLFSTKTYIAMPRSLTEEDQGRLESLCMLFGVGLALFDLDKDEPHFEIRMRAQRFSPDMFYVNEFADRLKFHDNPTFEKLFG